MENLDNWNVCEDGHWFATGRAIYTMAPTKLGIGYVVSIVDGASFRPVGLVMTLSEGAAVAARHSEVA